MLFNKSVKQTLLVTSIMALLTACGGGGGDSGSAAAPFASKPISGTAVDFYLANATVQLDDCKDSAGNPVFVKTDAAGNFKFNTTENCQNSAITVTGGTDIVAAVVNKYHNISLGRVLIFVDLLIIGSTIPIFGDWRKVVFGLATMVIENYVLDRVMNARRESVQFMIFSEKYQEIANAIGTEMNHGVTILDGHGWYTGKKVKVLCILAKKRESVYIFRLIKMIDPNAFVSQSNVIGVFGEGFDPIKVKVPKVKK